jgi:hypothetical protein
MSKAIKNESFIIAGCTFKSALLFLEKVKIAGVVG